MSPTLQILLKFVKRDASGSLDVTGILSRECYEAWLESKGEHVPKDPEDAFRKTITGHCKIFILHVELFSYLFCFLRQRNKTNEAFRTTC